MFFITFKNRSRFLKREITSIKFIKLLISYALSITIDPNLRWPKRRGFHQKKQKNHKNISKDNIDPDVVAAVWTILGYSR